MFIMIFAPRPFVRRSRLFLLLFQHGLDLIINLHKYPSPPATFFAKEQGYTMCKRSSFECDMEKYRTRPMNNV